MRIYTLYLLIFFICITLVNCTNKVKQDNTILSNSDCIAEVILTVREDSIRKQDQKEIWEEANKYKTTITDTTFLKTKGEMSYAAIDPLIGEGFNKKYAFNQIVYLEALKRAREHLSVVNGRLVCDLKSGAEIYIAEDLYQFITSLFKDWNMWLESGKYEIKKDEQGLYTVLFNKANQPTASLSNSQDQMGNPLKYDFNIVSIEKLPDNILNMVVQMKTEKAVYSTNTQSLIVIVDNPTDVPFMFGRDWRIQIKDDNDWIVPKMKKELYWTDDGSAANETYVRYYFKFPIGDFYELKVGEYRIVKTFYQESKRLDLVAEFEIK